MGTVAKTANSSRGRETGQTGTLELRAAQASYNLLWVELQIVYFTVYETTLLFPAENNNIHL